MSLETIRRASDVLGLFAVSHPEWGVTEVARQLDLSKTKAHALLSTLAEVGLLRSTAQNRYRMGWRTLHLNRILEETTPFRTQARPLMEALASSTGETARLAALERGRTVLIAKHEGTRSAPIDASHLGEEQPAHCSAVGKVLLAFRPWPEVERIIATHGLAPSTPDTITTSEVLRIELGTVRRDRVAWEREEAVPGLACVAAPIFGHTGLILAALSLAAPVQRFTRYRAAYRGAVVETAARVSARLGYVQRS